MNIFDLFTVDIIAAFWTEVTSNAIPYLGEILFPSDKKSGLDLSWIKGNEGLPVSLMPSAFDAKATFRDRPGLEKTATEMPFFREGMKLGEKERQKLLSLADQNASNPYIRDIIRTYLDDARRLIEGARVARERMRMALLFPTQATPRPGITIAANGVNYTYDYDPQGTWAAGNYIELTGAAKWDAPDTADPFSVIDTLRDQIAQSTGENITTLVMNRVTYNLLVNIEAIRNRFLTTNGLAVTYITPAEAAQVLEKTSNVRIAVYDKMYKDESGVAHKFVPDNYVAALPAGILGKTWFGTTPEEADLMTGTHDVTIVDKGVAVLKTVEEHPVALHTFVSQITLPSYERMGSVGLIKVA